MFFGLTDQARELRDGVREALATACPPAVVRAGWVGADPAAADALWRTLGDLGLLGVLVPEAHGGLGLDDLVAVAVLEEAGWAGVPGPLVETVVAAAPLLAAAGRLPAGSLEGSTRLTATTRDLTPYALLSDWVVQLGDGAARLLPGERDGAAAPTVDGSRHAALVTRSGELLAVEPSEVRLAELRATLGTAAFLLGLARRQLDLTVGYVKDRHQFGVPVGSFQAVKHPLADAVVGTEFAWPAVLRAAHSLATQDPDAAVHVSMAKALASDAAWQVSRVCLQAHGAMAYTTEYDLQLFAKRTWALAKDWGTASQHRARIVAHLDINLDLNLDIPERTAR